MRLTDTSFEDAANTVVLNVIEIERISQRIAETKRAMDSLERTLRREVEGRNQQERDDRLADLIDSDDEYSLLLTRWNELRLRRAQAEGGMELARLMARYFIAIAAIAGDEPARERAARV